MKIIKVQKQQTLIKLREFLENKGINEINFKGMKDLPNFVNFWKSMSNKAIFIATENDNIVGAIGGLFMLYYYNLDPKFKHFYNYFLVVDPEYRNKGVGSKLRKLMEKEVKQNNVKYIITASPSKETTEYYMKHDYNYFETVLIKEMI